MAKKRYIFYGGTREKNADGTIRPIGAAHNGAFYHAAINVEKDYKTGSIKVVKISTAAFLLNELNSNTSNSVSSLDIMSHGTPYSLNFSLKENVNCGIVTGWLAKQVLKAYYSSFDDGFYSFSNDSRYVSDIKYSVFSTDARIQIHGCNTARGSVPGDTLVEALSKNLFNSGKKTAYVIGHTDKSNPNINGDKTTIIQQDYRHGERSVYHNGEIIHQTYKKGLIEHDFIQSLLGNQK